MNKGLMNDQLFFLQLSLFFRSLLFLLLTGKVPEYWFQFNVIVSSGLEK